VNAPALFDVGSVIVKSASSYIFVGIVKLVIVEGPGLTVKVVVVVPDV
jgi:hypothetical protein